jgi:hypothetical protein
MAEAQATGMQNPLCSTGHPEARHLDDRSLAIFRHGEEGRPARHDEAMTAEFRRRVL